MTLGFWEHPPTQSYLENSLINSLKLTQIGHFSTGGDTLTVAAESSAAPKLISELYLETELAHKLTF